MNQKQLCSLCCNTYSEYKPLQTDFEWNETYNMTVKYFDPTLLTQDESTSPHRNTVLCQNCWGHINEFHGFQQNVIKTRTMKDNKAILQRLIIEVEEEVIQENVSTLNMVDNGSLKTNGNDKGPFENTFKYEDLKNESVTSYEEELKPILNQHSEQHEANSLHQNEDMYDNEHSLTTKTTHGQTSRIIKSPKSCEEVIEPIQNQYVGEERENSVYLDEENNVDDHNSKTKIKISKKSKSLNAKSTEEKRITRKSTLTKLTKNDVERRNHEPNLKRKNARKMQRFDRKTSRELNTIIAEWKPVLICDICNESTANFDRLRSHFEENHKTSVYVKCCERKFESRYLLANHFQLHLNPEFYKCDKCGKSYGTKGVLKAHLRLAHENRNHSKCDICGKIYTRKSSLVRHMITHSISNKDFICSKCGRGYLTAKSLEIHLKYVHIGDRVCDQCGKTFQGLYAYKKHIMDHSGIKRRKSPCDICGAEISVRNLKQHKEINHNNSSSIYICGVCGKVAPSKHALLNHKKQVHIAECKHKCTYCDKAFKRLVTLREHIATHTGDYLYKCPHCDKKFKSASNMYVHRKKNHPTEWKESRKKYLKCPKMNNNPVKKQI